MKKLITLIAILAIAGMAQAALIAYEDFGREDGVDVGDEIKASNLSSGNPLNPGYSVGTPGEFTGSDLVDPNGNLQTTANSSGYTHTHAALDNKYISWKHGGSVSNGGLFMSFLLNVPTTNGMQTSWSNDSDIMGLRSTTGSNVIGLRANGSGGYEIAVAERQSDLANGPGDAQTSDAITLTAGLTYLVVVGADDVTDSGVGSFEMWVNPTVLGGAAPTADTAGQWRTGTAANNNSLKLGDIDTNTGTATVLLDDIRIGTTFGDVTPVPEPATVGMLGLGALVALLARRIRA